jgi:LuxR family maltose regulon positive regulatory protein
MAHNTPFIQQKLLFFPPLAAPVCTIDSPQWFQWLQSATAFRFYSTQRVNHMRGYSPLLAPISLRKESRRRGHFWYAYRRASRQLYKRYVGRSEQLTLDKLNHATWRLNFCDDP